MRYVVFELAYPYIYVPMEDFNKLAAVINAQYQELNLSTSIACLAKVGRCLFREPCSELTSIGLLNLTLTDDSNNDYTISLRPESMLLDAAKLGMEDRYKCFIPIFGQRASTTQTWFVGQILLQHYYTIFDASDLAALDKLRVGIGPANPFDRIGEALIKKHHIAQQSGGTLVFYAFVLFLALTGCAIYSIKRQKELRAFNSQLPYTASHNEYREKVPSNNPYTTPAGYAPNINDSRYEEANESMF